MDINQIPIIDISRYRSGPTPERDAIAAEVDHACRSIGFLMISGHAVDPHLQASMRAVSAAFFDQPEAYKLTFHRPDTSRGYVPVGVENLAATAGNEAVPATSGDLKEAFAVSRVDLASGANEFVTADLNPVMWPDNPPGFRDTWQRYYQAIHRLASTITRLFADALGIASSFFDDKLNLSADFLRAINYPPQPAPPAAGQLRAGAHTDFGALTILMVDDAPGGLQVCPPNGSWVDVPHVPATFVVNIGDMMAHWTNYRWRSTVHRVKNPQRQVAATARRQSVVFFHNPNLDAVIEPIPTCRIPGEPVAEAVTAGQWLRDQALRQRAGRAAR